MTLYAVYVCVCVSVHVFVCARIQQPKDLAQTNPAGSFQQLITHSSPLCRVARQPNHRRMGSGWGVGEARLLKAGRRTETKRERMREEENVGTMGTCNKVGQMQDQQLKRQRNKETNRHTNE